MSTAGVANAHPYGTHSHRPVAPDVVKRACAVKVDHPRVCVNRWKQEHAYTHRHGHGRHYGRGHHRGHGKVKVRLGVTFPIGG